ENLIQVNVEGIVQLYSDDLGKFYAKLKTETKLVDKGMRPGEAEAIKKGGEGLPKKGWVVELRGSTSHARGSDFVVETLVENLANPTAAGIKLDKEIDEHVRKRLKCVFLYTSKVDETP